MTFKECVRKKISRIRDAKWANPEAYIKIDLIEENGAVGHGPWLHLYDRKTQEAIGEPTPQDILFLMGNIRTCDDIMEYTGPIDPQEK